MVQRREAPGAFAETRVEFTVLTGRRAAILVSADAAEFSWVECILALLAAGARLQIVRRGLPYSGYTTELAERRLYFSIPPLSFIRDHFASLVVMALVGWMV